MDTMRARSEGRGVRALNKFLPHVETIYNIFGLLKTREIYWQTKWLVRFNYYLTIKLAAIALLMYTHERILLRRSVDIASTYCSIGDAPSSGNLGYMSSAVSILGGPYKLLANRAAMLYAILAIAMCTMLVMFAEEIAKNLKFRMNSLRFIFDNEQYMECVKADHEDYLGQLAQMPRSSNYKALKKLAKSMQAKDEGQDGAPPNGRDSDQAHAADESRASRSAGSSRRSGSRKRNKLALKMSPVKGVAPARTVREKPKTDKNLPPPARSLVMHGHHCCMSYKFSSQYYLSKIAQKVKKVTQVDETLDENEQPVAGTSRSADSGPNVGRAHYKPPIELTIIREVPAADEHTDIAGIEREAPVAEPENNSAESNVARRRWVRPRSNRFSTGHIKWPRVRLIASKTEPQLRPLRAMPAMNSLRRFMPFVRSKTWFDISRVVTSLLIIGFFIMLLCALVLVRNFFATQLDKTLDACKHSASPGKETINRWSPYDWIFYCELHYIALALCVALSFFAASFFGTILELIVWAREVLQQLELSSHVLKKLHILTYPPAEGLDISPMALSLINYPEGTHWVDVHVNHYGSFNQFGASEGVSAPETPRQNRLLEMMALRLLGHKESLTRSACLNVWLFFNELNRTRLLVETIMQRTTSIACGIAFMATLTKSQFSAQYAHINALLILTWGTLTIYLSCGAIVHTKAVMLRGGPANADQITFLDKFIKSFGGDENVTAYQVNGNKVDWSGIVTLGGVILAVYTLTM